MCKVLKTIMLWMLLLAMPIQGFAATSMLTCEPSHQRVEAGAHLAHVHAAKAQPDQHHLHQTAAAATDDGAAAHPHMSSCSACAACCVGAPLISSLSLSLPAFDAVSERIAYIPAYLPGVVPDQPEHPPRVFLV